MSTDRFPEDALVLLAHGSTVHPGSNQPAWQHADALRSRGCFREVHVGFWKEEPFVMGAIRRVRARRVFVVPLLVADGWFAERVFPCALGLREPGAATFERVTDVEGRRVHYCGVVGSHPSMTEVLLARAAGVVAKHPFPRAPRPDETALVVVGHGTGYSRGSREALERQVESLRGRGLYAEVTAVFLEEAPRVEDCFECTRARHLVLVPFFISDGLHAQEDIPIMLGDPEAVVRRRLAAGKPGWPNPTERRGRRIWCAGSVGTEPRLAEVILQRVREAATGPGGGE